MKTKAKTWSRKKIRDRFSGLLKADGTPMSRQQIHMARKKAQGICLTCGETGHRRVLPEAHHRGARTHAPKIEISPPPAQFIQLRVGEGSPLQTASCRRPSPSARRTRSRSKVGAWPGVKPPFCRGLRSKVKSHHTNIRQKAAPAPKGMMCSKAVGVCPRNIKASQ